MKSIPPALILLVEDDDQLRSLGADTLISAGYRVQEAVDGVAALEFLARETPDLILSDVRMPRCDGFELLQWVRRNPMLGLVPFVVVSARVDTPDIRMGMSLGADDYLTKPYLPADLLKTVATRLERAGQLVEVQESHQWFLSRVLPHELRTPLSGILSCGDLLLQAGEAGDPVPAAYALEYGKLINLGGQRLLRVAEDLSLWALLENLRQNRQHSGDGAGGIRVGIDPTLLEKSFRQCAESFGRGADLSVTLELSTVESPVNEVAVVAVIRHLVDNAFKFSLPGQQVRILGFVAWDRYVIEVRDAGRGFAAGERIGPAAMRQVNREYWEQQGIGVGLTIVRLFARLADGTFALQPLPAPETGMVARLGLRLARASGAREVANAGGGEVEPAVVTCSEESHEGA
jgi:CheY-like chemotaxis protein